MVLFVQKKSSLCPEAVIRFLRVAAAPDLERFRNPIQRIHGLKRPVFKPGEPEKAQHNAQNRQYRFMQSGTTGQICRQHCQHRQNPQYREPAIGAESAGSAEAQSKPQ